MVTWECGSCGADFQDAFKLEAHRVEAHGERPPPHGEYRFPQSAREKPLGRETPAPTRKDLHGRRAGDMDETRSEVERLREEHPTGAPGVKQEGREQGRVGHKKKE